jgi:hypothetical protein
MEVVDDMLEDLALLVKGEEMYARGGVPTSEEVIVSMNAEELREYSNRSREQYRIFVS